MKSRLAFALLGLTIALLIAAVTIQHRSGADGSLTGVFLWAIALVFSGVGALIARREASNAIGWLFLGTGVTAGLAELAHGYADLWLAGEVGSDAVGEAAAWYASLSWIPFILVPSTFLLLLFPDGRLVSRRWRPVAWCAALGIAGVFGVTGLTPGGLDDYPQLANPYAVDSPVLDPLTGVAFLTLFAGVVGSSVSLVVRFRQATGTERLQIKWLAFAGAIVGVTFPVATVGFDLWPATISNVAIMVSVLGLPAAAGVAILRHRLYDIDVVINRTLVYGALTAVLGGAYLGSVLLLQLILSPSSDLAIAVSTLAVAALFRPVRARIQALVDRRFYRRRYDAERTLETFSARLRNEVSLDALEAELRSVARETVQPAHVSLWVRP
jgi:hypothetical protein